MPRINSYSPGFTITELAVVIVMIPLIVSLFIYALYAISDQSSQQSVKLALSDSAQLAMDSIESDVRLSSAFNQTVPSPFTDPYGRDNSGSSWSFVGTSSTNRALLLASIATTQNKATESRVPVYIDGPTFNCTTEMRYNPMATYMTIYFVRSEKLYRRILTDNTSTLCNGPAGQKQSCPPELSSSWNAVCKVRDEIIASEVSAFSVDYFTLREAAPISNIYANLDPDDMDIADDAEVTLTLTRGNGTSAVTSSQKLRIARLNQN